MSDLFGVPAQDGVPKTLDGVLTAILKVTYRQICSKKAPPLSTKASSILEISRFAPATPHTFYWFKAPSHSKAKFRVSEGVGLLTTNSPEKRKGVIGNIESIRHGLNELQ